MTERREAALHIEAYKGDQRAARGLVGRAIKQALDVRKWGVAPYHVHYSPVSRYDDGTVADGRYYIELTESEQARVWDRLKVLADEEGWHGVPASFY